MSAFQGISYTREPVRNRHTGYQNNAIMKALSLLTRPDVEGHQQRAEHRNHERANAKSSLYIMHQARP